MLFRSGMFLDSSWWRRDSRKRGFEGGRWLESWRRGIQGPPPSKQQQKRVDWFTLTIRMYFPCCEKKIVTSVGHIHTPLTNCLLPWLDLSPLPRRDPYLLLLSQWAFGDWLWVQMSSVTVIRSANKGCHWKKESLFSTLEDMSPFLPVPVCSPRN